MVTKFDIGDKVEPKNLQFVVQGIRVCSGVYSGSHTTYDIAIMDEVNEHEVGKCTVPEDGIDRFFAKGATLLC